MNNASNQWRLGPFKSAKFNLVSVAVLTLVIGITTFQYYWYVALSTVPKINFNFQKIEPLKGVFKSAEYRARGTCLPATLDGKTFYAGIFSFYSTIGSMCTELRIFDGKEVIVDRVLVPTVSGLYPQALNIYISNSDFKYSFAN